MRKTLIVASALLVGCAADTTRPLRLPASVSVTFSNTPGDTTVTASGDRATATLTVPYGCSGDVTAAAGTEGGTLVIVISDSLPGAVPCAYLAGYRVYQATVGPLRPGSYPVELRLRNVVASSVNESVVLRTALTIR